MHSILDSWRGSEYACVQIASNNVLCHHNKHLMRYFEFLHGSGIIVLPLNIPGKLHWQHLFEKQEDVGLIAFILVNTIQYPRTLTNYIYHSNKQIQTPFFHSDTNTVVCHAVIHSADKSHVLVVTVELIWLLLLSILSFNFVPTSNKSLLG